MMSFPFYKQYDVMDCGPTCIRIIARYYGKNYSLQFLRDKCNIGKTGVSMYGISKASEEIGFNTFGAKTNLNELGTEVLLPCIAHWDQNHFVVIYKVTASKIYISNPDSGLVTYSIDEFLEHWASDKSGTNQTGEGVVLMLEPTDEFYSRKSVEPPKNTIWELLKYFKNYKQTLSQLLIALFISSLLQLSFPFLTQSILDVGVYTKDIQFVYVILLAQLVLFAGQFACNFFRNWLLLYMSTKINVSILSDFIQKLMRVPISFFDVKLAGDLIQRMNDHKKVEAFLTGSTLNTLFSLFNLLIFGIAIFIYNKIVCGVYILFSVAYIAYILFFLKQRKTVETRSMEMASTIQGNSLQMIYGIQDIRLNNAESVKRAEWESLQSQLFQVNIQKLKIEQWQEVGAFIINQSKNLFITFYTAYLVIGNQLTLGEMLACQFIIGQLNGPLEQLIHFTLVGQDARLALSRIKEINEIEDEEQQGLYNPIESELSTNHDIRFDNVSFIYPGLNEKVLQDINFVIPAGKVTAIVGSSGSGKTTLIKLLLKIYTPSSGEINLGGLNFKSIKPSIWREKMGTVMQDGFIFSDTIEKNITIGDTKNPIDQTKLQQAVNIANLGDLINTLPNGLQSKVGAEGMGLSQGQKQRILIARAVYKNPEILFLDEATNALDANNEKEIVNSFDHFFRGKTVIVVAHRLSTVKNADQIVLLHKGVIAEIGTHSQLIAKKGGYYMLVKNQLELGM